MRPVNASVASLSTVVFKSSQPASIPPLVETFYANTSFHRTTFTLSHLGGGDPVSSCKALHIGTSFDKCSSMPTRQCLQVPSMCQLTYFQVVHWEGQSNDMCHQVAHPSQMEERVAQEPCLISTYVKWSSHAHNCRPSCPSQLLPLLPFTTVAPPALHNCHFPQSRHPTTQGAFQYGTRASTMLTFYSSLDATPKSWYSIAPAQEGTDCHQWWCGDI
jgi:hypothetical protein